MEQADSLSLPSATWETKYLEDIKVRRLVLELYDREHVAIRRYLSSLGVETETGREIIQETFLKLHQHLLGGGDQSNLRAWLYRVAHNLARNGQASFRASKTDFLSDVAITGDLPAHAVSAEDALLAAERTQRFREALRQLNPAQRESLILRAQGMKYREIAEVLNLSISTVSENVGRGLEKLKELI
jgi:RNA polymerase sigma-70 factor (ECF subfamily)